MPVSFTVLTNMDLFAEETDIDNGKVKPLSFEPYQKLIAQLGKRSKDAILPVQIAYLTGLRLGEVAGLTWQDISFEEQRLTVHRSVRYNGATHKHGIGSTKRKKVRVVDFGNAPADILKKARKQQLKNRMQYGELYHRNFYKEVTEKNRVPCSQYLSMMSCLAGSLFLAEAGISMFPFCRRRLIQL